MSLRNPHEEYRHIGTFPLLLHEAEADFYMNESGFIAVYRNNDVKLQSQNAASELEASLNLECLITRLKEEGNESNLPQLKVIEENTRIYL